MGYEYVMGRPTRIQKTERTPNVLPEIWTTLSSGQKNKAKQDWARYLPILEAARKKAGVKSVVPDQEVPEYNAIMDR